jgi:hypothetical protein
MPWFDIEPEGAKAGGRRLIFTVEAATWMEAVQDAGRRLRPSSPLRNLQVEFGADGAVFAVEEHNGLRLHITPRERPGASSPTQDEVPQAVRQSPKLVPRPKIVQGKNFATYTAPRMALPRPPTPDGPPLETTRVARGSGRTPVVPPAAPAPPRAQPLPRPAPFELPPEVLSRVKRACWSGPSTRSLEALLDLALELVPSESASAFMPDADGMLALVAAWGPRARRILESGLRLPPDVGIVGTCVSKRTLVLVADVQQDPRFREDVARSVDYAVKSILAVPVCSGKRVHGCLELLNRKHGMPFTDLDAVKISRLAHAAGAFYEGHA